MAPGGSEEFGRFHQSKGKGKGVPDVALIAAAIDQFAEDLSCFLNGGCHRMRQGR
jgi:hypothetical protein